MGDDLTGQQKSQLEKLIAKMKSDIVEFARQVEIAYKNRCTTSLDDCARNNYDGCVSEFPNATCRLNAELAIEACNASASDNCGALFDFTTSNIRLPPDIANGKGGNLTDPQVIESVCYTRQLDEYFRNKQQNDSTFWKEYGVESPNMHFGSKDGMFRIFPGRSDSDKVCGNFDPRLRPWYIAASSGTKNVVMVLDVSESMSGKRMDQLKLAATRVIETLTVDDKVAIVHFNSTAHVIGTGDGHLLTANEVNKDFLVKEIEGLVAGGVTNFTNAFELAFDTLSAGIGCNYAILFLTGGEMTEPQETQHETVINLVSTRLNNMQAAGKPVMLFTYSISNNDTNVSTFPKELACSTGKLGVWSKIVDDDKNVDSLNSYYRLFTLGLASDQQKDFVTWVEPYSFATGGVKGTTVSTPVYDRSGQEPYLFLGVVGIDFPLADIEQALGIQANNIRDVLGSLGRESSSPSCTALNLTDCELELFRYSSSGDDALCTRGVCSEESLVVVDPLCPGISDYPDELLANSNFMNAFHKERSCCGLSDPSNQCPAPFATQPNTGTSKKQTTIIVTCSVAGLILFLLFCTAAVWAWLGPRRIQIPKFENDGHNKIVSDPSRPSSSRTEEILDTESEENGISSSGPAEEQVETSSNLVAHATLESFVDTQRSQSEKIQDVPDVAPFAMAVLLPPTAVPPPTAIGEVLPERDS